jgi:CheY-like chemotaxis protein
MNAPARILYVEDEPDDVFFMRDAFRRLGVESGFDAVEDGGRAIAYLSGRTPYEDRVQHPLPACVLLDVNLPVRSGFEVLAWLREQPEMARLPVVIFSSSGRLEDRQRAEQLGATDYILKPTSGREFMQAARRVVGTWLLSSEESLVKAPETKSAAE